MEQRTLKFRAWDITSEEPYMTFFGIGGGFSGMNECPIMQFTGLLDKHGKEIYEGDIVKVRNIKEPQLIGYDAGWLCYCFVYETGEIMRKITPREMLTLEIIGDKYQNPDLLS